MIIILVLCIIVRMYELSQSSQEDQINHSKTVRKIRIQTRMGNMSQIVGDHSPQMIKRAEIQGNMRKGEEDKKKKKVREDKEENQMKQLQKIREVKREKEEKNMNLNESPFLQLMISNLKKDHCDKRQEHEQQQKPEPLHIRPSDQSNQSKKQQAQLKPGQSPLLSASLADNLRQIKGQVNILSQSVEQQRQMRHSWKEEVKRQIRNDIQASIHQKLTDHSREVSKEQKDIKHLLLAVLQSQQKSQQKMDRLQKGMQKITDHLQIISRKMQT